MTDSKKPEMMLELEALVRAKNPQYTTQVTYAALFGILAAFISEEDFQRAIEIWPKIDEKKA